MTQISLSRRVIRAGLIALIPVSGYAVAFSYEWGYCSYFGIPLSIISLSITSVFVALIAFALGFVIFGFIFNYVDTALTLGDEEFQHIRVTAIVWLAVTFLSGVYLDIIGFGYWIGFSLFFAIIIYPFARRSIWKLFRRIVLDPRRAKKGLPPYDESAVRRKHVVQFPFIPIGLIAFKNALATILVVIISFDTGYHVASTQTGYFVVGDQFVARIYGDTIVRMRFVRSSRIAPTLFVRSLILSKVGERKAITMAFESLGVMEPQGWKGPEQRDSSEPWNPHRWKKPLFIQL